jgi:hypothetical protein
MSNARGVASWPRLGLLVGLITVVAACGGGTAGASTGTPAPGGASSPAGPSSPASVDPGGEQQSPDGGAPSDSGGNSAGDPAKGSAKVTVTGGLNATLDLPFAAVLALWESSGPGSAYLPFTDGDAVLFMTINAGQLLVQYATTSTGVGLTSGATPCTFSAETLDGSTAKGSFACKSMTLIQGQTVGTADVTGTFEAHK